MPTFWISIPRSGVLGENSRVVVSRIERDREQNEILSKFVHETPLQDAEIIRAPKAKIRQSTSRINEIEHNGFPGKSRKSHPAILLVSEDEVRNCIAHLQRFYLRRIRHLI